MRADGCRRDGAERIEWRARKHRRQQQQRLHGDPRRMPQRHNGHQRHEYECALTQHAGGYDTSVRTTRREHSAPSGGPWPGRSGRRGHPRRLRPSHSDPLDVRACTHPGACEVKGNCRHRPGADSLDPTADATASIALCLRDNLYEGLVRLDGSGKIIGSLARSWDVNPDGTTFTFKLVSGAKWHDGTPFSAQDVKFAWERAGDATRAGQSDTATTGRPSKHRRHRRPDGQSNAEHYSDNWLYHMAAGSACIVASKSAATNTTNPIGTGPFKYGTWNRGSSLALTRNDDYWGTKAKLRTSSSASSATPTP